MAWESPYRRRFSPAAQIALNSQLKQAFEQHEPDLDAIQSYLKEAAATSIALDVPGLEYAIRRRLETEAEVFAAVPSNQEVVQKLTTLLKFVSTLPFPVVLWEVQNICYGPLIRTMDELREQAQAENATTKIFSRRLRCFAKTCGSMVNSGQWNVADRNFPMERRTPISATYRLPVQ